MLKIDCLVRMQSTPHKKIHRVSSILDLPTCILVDILSRLPIDSIFNCIYVCKTWFNLVSDPYFASVYCERPPHISLLLERNFRCFDLLELKWDYNSPPTVGKKFLKTPPDSPYYGKYLFGCCNGLVCLTEVKYKSNDYIYICNPLLREYVKLPQPNIVKSSCGREKIGFGYHPTTGQYKVLRIAQVQGGDDKLKSEAEVFTLGVDHTWRYVGDAVAFPDLKRLCHLPLNGALHWFATKVSPKDPCCLYSFDIKEEKVRPITLPIPIDGQGDNVLGVLRNCLCVFSHFYSYGKRELVIWCMRKYGAVESWTKEAVIDMRCIAPCFTCPPVAIWRDGEILLCNSHTCSVFLYNPKRKEVRSHVLVEERLLLEEGGLLFDFIPFVTSSVSLKNVMKEGHLEVVKMN